MKKNTQKKEKIFLKIPKKLPKKKSGPIFLLLFFQAKRRPE